MPAVIQAWRAAVTTAIPTTSMDLNEKIQPLRSKGGKESQRGRS